MSNVVSKSLRRGLRTACAVLGVLVCAPAAAQAGVGLSTTPDIPLPNGPLTVGQAGVASAVTITNLSSGVQGSLTVTLDTITIVPSCGTNASVNCPAASFDPDVFALSATGTGRAGTACASQVFAITNVDSLQDKYEFVPSSPATPVVLGPADTGGPAAQCTIDFTVSVLRVPSIDASPAAGVQTGNLAAANGTASDSQTGSGTGTNFTTVNRATPPIATAVSNPTRTLGQSFTDTASLTPPPATVPPTGSVTFRVYTDASCAASPVFTSTNPLNAAGTSATSSSFTPTSPGTYRVIATYNGDANYNAVAGACNDANEQVVITKATPSIATAVSSPTRTLGQSFTDTANVTVGAGFPAPTGTVSFSVYGPGDTTCAAAPAFTSTNPLNGSGAATSANFIPTATGTYRAIATYSGDANYNAVAGACNDANEQVVVSKATPALATQVSNSTRTLGQSFTDIATVTWSAGGPAATGTVAFVVYGPGDTTCSGAPVFTSAGRPLTGVSATTATASSASFTPAAPGTYRVIATYSGDANYNAVAGACNDPSEQVAVSKATPAMTTLVSNPTRTLGQSFTDVATVTFPAGAPTPTGTVTFTVYGPGDATCTGAPVFTSAGRPLTSASATTATATSASFTPTVPGTYRVIATYSGDANYNAVAGACNDPNEQVVVSKASPAIATLVSAAARTLGQSFTDTANVTVPAGLPAPTGTVGFSVYGPGDTTCTAAPAFTSTNALDGSGAATSSSFIPTAPGTYRAIATYSGDANYNTAAGACNDADEQVVVAKATPAISTTASPDIALGAGTLTDSATVSGRFDPSASASVTFTLYGPDDATCSGTPVFAPPAVAYPPPGGAVTSPEFTPTEAGSYRWGAAYSGDANNAAVSGACGDPDETTVVSAGAPAPPTLVTRASPTITLGDTVTDSVTVSGRTNPVAGATIDFRLYGPDDATCAGTPAFESLAVDYPAAGGEVSSTAFAPTQSGQYRWRVFYSGDANNAATSLPCNAPGQDVGVAASPPPAPIPPPVPPPPPGPATDDPDGDGVPDATDNCPADNNPTQSDRDTDRIGDACDSSDASVGPTLAKTVIGRVVTGQVYVKRPGVSPRSSARAAQLPADVPKGFTLLKGAEVLPIGTIVHATRGRLALTSAAGRGSNGRNLTQRAEFYDAQFQIRQKRAAKPITDLALRSPTFSKVCGSSLRATTGYAAKPRSKRVVASLWGSGRGRFRTIGRHSSATVRGTIWLTQERCDGTLTRVTRGTVSVRDTTRNVTVTVRAGHSYLARAQRATVKTATR